MTHPFHPLSGEVLDLFRYRRSQRSEWVDATGRDGRVVSLPLAWTDAAGEDDPFLVFSAGRSYFRVEDLLRLATLVDSGRAESLEMRRGRGREGLEEECQENSVRSVE